GPTASFSVTNNQICASKAVNFTDASTTDGQNAIIEFSWNYGDGTSVNYTAAPFGHIYSNAGTFSVQLKVKDTRGCTDSIMINNAVNVSKSIAKFTEVDTLVCPGTPLQFTSQSTGNNLQHLWSFSNGVQSTQTNPVITFAEGTYTVQLSVVDPLGCADTIIKTNRIKVYNPIARFNMSDSFAVCPPLLVNMMNSSIHAGNSFWSFGDGSNALLVNPSHLFTYPGNYNVQLVVRNTGGCADSTLKQVIIKGPTGVFSYLPNLACSPVIVSFNAQTQNTIKNIWDFNDGIVETTTANTTTHTYTLGNNYLPRLILEDASGCRVPVLGKDTIKVKVVQAFAKIPNQLICDSANVQLLDSTITNDIITKYQWSFSNGATSTQVNPIQSFKTNGFISIKLKVITQTGCSDSITYQNKIKVVSSPKAIVKGDTAVCKNGTIVFSSDRINADTSSVKWNWSFGNGLTSTMQNPTAQTYNNAGSFNLVHQITNSSGCITTTNKTIIVHQLPNVNAGLDTTICRNTTYRLQATGAVSYTWYGNTNSLNCINCPNPTATPFTTITYGVVGKNAFNCIAADSVTVRVQQPLKLSVTSGDTLCLGETTTIKATGTEKYNWHPSLYVDNPNNAQVNIRPAKDTTINYRLIGKDNHNCFADTAFVKIKTFPIPKMEINQNEIIVNAGNSVKIKTTNSTDITKWKWLPNKFIDNANIAEPTMVARESITYTCVASNEGNCVTRDEVKVVVVCNNGNIFVPNTFTPNADGNNDIFYPRGKGIYTIKSLRIFNRWGEMVFEKSNFQANDMSAGWDGTYKGQKLASDAYVYSLEIMCDNSTTVPTKGSITLIR
nr:PKD domain-containing protein [Chitinophagaceae bacterium]